MSLLLTGVEVDGVLVDVRVRGGLVQDVGGGLRAGPDDEAVDGGGAALLPGLHDHHLHVMALGAAAGSVRCGPPEVGDVEGLRRALTGAPGRSWVRGVGYHESVGGHLDRDLLDRLVADRPVRVQHRSGALWVLNSVALELLALEQEPSPEVERDAQGRLTGRLWRWDDRLRARLGADLPDLGLVGQRLAAVGVTGVTDATPDLDAATCELLRRGLPQRVEVLGAQGPGPRKLLLHDHDLPTFDDLVSSVVGARAEGRAVAVHCVTREALLLTLAVLEQVGTTPGDRIEHAAVVPPEAARTLAAQGIAVVTQPCFVADRGDDYLRDVEPEDRQLLYPYASLLRAGVRVAPSSDAPFGDPDPWRGITAAMTRRSRSGAVLNADECVAARVALDGYLSPLHDPGGPPRRVAVGASADLVLLHVPLRVALADPSAEHVRQVWIDGQPVRP